MSHHADVSVRWNCYLGSFNNYNDDIRIDIDRLIMLTHHSPFHIRILALKLWFLLTINPPSFLHTDVC